MACNHHLWGAQTVKRQRAWHSIIPFGLAHIVGWRQAWHAIITLGRPTRSNDVGRGMPSSPFGSTHGRTTLGMACHHLLWAAHTVERRRVWHALGQQTRSDDVRRDMRHCLWTAHTVERLRAWHSIIAFGHHTRSTTSGVACHHSPWTAHTVGRRQALHAIIAFGQHTQSNDVGRGMPSSPFDSIDGRPSSDVPAHNGRPWPARIGRGLRNIHRVPNKTCGCSWRT